MRQIHWAWRTQLVVAMAITVVLWAWDQAGAQAKKDVVITTYQTSPITEMAIFTSIPMYMKYYDGEGLNVSFRGAPGGADAIQMMISGGAQLVYIGTYPPIVARSKGVPLKSFLRSSQAPAGYPAVLEMSPIRDVKQFKGKIVGVNSLGTGVIPLIRAMLAEAGMDSEKDVNFVVAGVGSQALAAIQTGKVEILGLWDAAYWEIEALGAHRFRKVSSPLLESLTWTLGMFAMDDYIRRNLDVVVGVGRAISKACVVAKVNPEAAVRMHWKVFPETKPTGIDEATALKRQTEILQKRVDTLKLDLASMRAFGTADEKEVRAMYEFLLKSKALGKEFDPKELFTNEFIARINDYDVGAVERAARGIRVD